MHRFARGMEVLEVESKVGGFSADIYAKQEKEEV